MTDLSLSRRSFAFGGALVLGGHAVLSSRVTAQDTAATAVGGGGEFASLGLPALDITVNADSFGGAPSDAIPAGRYLVTANIAKGLESGAAAFMSPPEGMTAEDFLDAVGNGGGGVPTPAVTPEGSPEAGGEEDMQLPLFVYKATFAGGASGPGGTTGQSVIDLPPGEWILWGDDPSAPQTPVTFEVTGDMPASLPEPNADITFTLIDFQIMVDGNLTAGDHVVKLQNHGAQPHFVVLMKGPDSLTNEMVSEILQSELDGGTPPALPFDPEKDLVPITQTATQSIGTDQWVMMSLDEGTYAALCFFPTAGTGVPHAMLGMHAVFKVA